MRTPHRCKFHKYSHPYTVCPTCRHEYCGLMYRSCPRFSWHPLHGATDAEMGKRTRALSEPRQVMERDLSDGNDDVSGL